MTPFAYSRPTSVADAAAALARSPDARLLAGGHTLIPTMKQRLAKPGSLIDLGAISELLGISQNGNELLIGAMTTHAQVASSDLVRSAIPALASLAAVIGDAQVRHRGTIGGSLANNDPAADYPAAALGLGAAIVTSKRRIAADDYFKGLFTTALEHDEIITAVAFPVPEKAAYQKFEQRASRFALAGVFVAMTSSKVRVAVTGCGETGVFRMTSFETALERNFNPAALETSKVPDSGMMSDMHGSAAYRANLIKVLTERAVNSA